MKIYENELMAKHTTFRVGGPAWRYIEVNNIEELQSVTQTLSENGKDYMILGNGSNLLVSDEGIDMAVISLEGEFKTIQLEENTITAGAGMLLSQVAAKALEDGLTGMEFAAGIPGTIGGAMVMNAGAYGGEMKDIVTSVLVMDETGKFLELETAELELGYRDSIFKRQNYIVLKVQVTLEKGLKESIKARMDELAQMRRDKQPLEYASAGSTFKRPEGYFAGKLIEDAGLKGFSIGDACVSEKHCGFVVNKGNATAGDIYRVIKDTQDKVLKNSGVKLETEVILLGNF